MAECMAWYLPFNIKARVQSLYSRQIYFYGFWMVKVLELIPSCGQYSKSLSQRTLNWV